MQQHGFWSQKEKILYQSDIRCMILRKFLNLSESQFHKDNVLFKGDKQVFGNSSKSVFCVWISPFFFLTAK